MVQLQIELPEHFLDEEIRCGYTVTRQMKEVWAIELDLLVQVQKICEKYGIQYFADSGTLLGAARHKGFIPWDDDIDLMMDRANFEKFSEIAKKEFSEPYFFQDEYVEHGSLRLMGKFLRSDTTAIHKVDKDRDFKFNQGIFIDIICFDNIPDDADERQKFFKKARRLRKSAKHLNAFSYRCNTSKDKFFLKKFLKSSFSFFYTGLHLPNFYFLWLNCFAQKYNMLQTQEFGSVMYEGLREPPQEHSDYAQTVMLPFEFLAISCPKNYENVLNKQYGTWKEFEIGTAHHGEMIFDTNRPYTEYVEMFRKGNGSI